MRSRRRLLLLPLLAFFSASRLLAQQRPSLADPLRVGVDLALVESGLAKALQKGFGLDTGIAVKLVPGPALPLLGALERGELDATLTNAPEAEARLDQQGLGHDLHAIAKGEFLLVGPRPNPREKDIAAILGLPKAAEALALVRSAAMALPGQVVFLSAADGSGLHVAEQALWRLARLAPNGPWYQAAGSGGSLLSQARARGAYALVERGAWAAEGGAPLAVLVEGDPALAESVQWLRAFRVNHPAGKIFTTWITGPKGRRVVAAQRAYRPA